MFNLIRTIIWFAYFWITLIILTPSLIRVKVLDKKGEVDKKDSLVNIKVKWWARSLLKLSGCEIEVIGKENIPKDKNVLFVSNHQGNFDIPILLAHIEKPKAFIAKKELEKLPLVNRWMKAMNCIFMDRKSPRESIKSILTGIELLKDGYSLVLFPEGTRSEDGKLREFKPGGLKLATKSKVPIIPVTINGSKDIMKKGSLSIRPAKVTVIISKAIDVSEYSDDTKELTQDIYNIISKNLV